VAGNKNKKPGGSSALKVTALGRKPGIWERSPMKLQNHCDCPLEQGPMPIHDKKVQQGGKELRICSQNPQTKQNTADTGTLLGAVMNTRPLT